VGKTVIVTLHVSGDAELEIWAARGRSDLFEKVFKRPVQFVVLSHENEAA
jgi:exopolyphosphatase/guanosine-5'-triphosphate,3'-diphosphate pyrophosphatase